MFFNLFCAQIAVWALFVAKVISLNPLKKQAVERANEYQGNDAIWNPHRLPPPNKVAQPPWHGIRLSLAQVSTDHAPHTS